MTWEAYELFRVGEQGMLQLFVFASLANVTLRLGLGA